MSQLSDKVKVFTSYDNIRLQVIDLLLSDLGLSETDLHRGTFVSYMIDMLSFLTSNLMFYSGMSYQEAFMTLAQLPESVYNLSAFLGYKPQNARPCECDVLIQIPLGDISDAVTIAFQQDHAFNAGDIKYRLKYKVEVTIDNANNHYSVTVIDPNNGVIYNLPYIIQNNKLTFTVSTVQQDKLEFNIVSNPIKQIYTFSRYPIDFEHQLADVEVYVNDEPWNQFDSVYLMRASDPGYVVRTTETGAIIMFGNGIFGKQPPPSSSIKVIAYVTLGEDGKIVAGAIKRGDRIYYDTPQGRKQLLYECTNPSSSIGGQNIESIDDVRHNALINMQAQKRLVSRYDYSNFATITKFPFHDTISILKRSDLKCNEVALYSIFNFNNDIVPTRTILVSGKLSDMHLMPLTELTYDGETYYNLFEYSPQINSKFVMTYYYANSVMFVPTVVNSALQQDDIVVTKGYINVDTSTQIATIELYVQVDDLSNYETVLRIKKDDFDISYTMNNQEVQNVKKFYISIPLHEIPSSTLQFYFIIRNVNTDVQVYYLSTQQIVKQSLEEVCFSNFVWLTDNAYITEEDEILYPVPVVKKDWYDNLLEEERSAFNTSLINKFVSQSASIYRMTNSAVNIQFGNTYGKLTNMEHNKTSFNVRTMSLLEPPNDVTVNDTFVVAAFGDKIIDTSNPWYGQEKKIAKCINDNPVEWSFIDPSLSTIVLNNEDDKKYIWNGDKWFDVTSLQLPLTIELEVFTDPQYQSSGNIATEVKNILYDYFSSQFGLLKPLFRAELIRIAQSVPGVVYCRVNKPEFDIFFNFKISDLSADKLFEFVPDYIYFTPDNIHIITNVYSASVEE